MVTKQFTNRNSRCVPMRTHSPRCTLTLDEFLAACAVVTQRPNPEQRAAIEAAATEDLHIVAGPGTGKTGSLVLRMLKVVLVDGLRPSGIVATTFTVKAAVELRSRLLTRGFALVERLAADLTLPASVRERVAKLDINQITTNTVDGLCQTVLHDYREPGTNPPAIVDEFVASTLMLNSGLLEERRYLDPSLDAFLCNLRGTGRFGWNIGRKLEVLRAMWDRRFHDQIAWDDFTAAPGVPSAFGAALAAYEAELARRQMVDFALLEQTILERLRAGGLTTFTQSVQAIFGDEYQDTNLLQESIYFALARASGGSLTIVGDDDQSLYRFRGATVSLFRDFPSRCATALRRPHPRTIFLRQNYRSTFAIVDFVNSYARLDPAYQPVRVSGKPTLIDRGDDREVIPILGLFRPDAQTLASHLANFVEAVFLRGGYNLSNGQRICAAQDGNVGDAALLSALRSSEGCCSPPSIPISPSRRKLPVACETLRRPLLIGG
jgi:DNA helicase-2/ATP-dependent DNA helicase PcrA